MNKLRKISVYILSLMITLSCFAFSASAAAKTTVSPDKQTLNVGEQLKVTVTFSADEVFYGASGYLQYNAEVLEHNPSNVNDSKFGADVAKMIAEGGSKKASVTLTFTAKKSGSSNLRVYGCTYAIDEEFPMDGASVSVNVIDKANLSGNANLKSMILSDNIPLTPAFNKDVTTYNIKVDNSVEKVLINAVPEDSGAKLSYGGSSKMKVGDNQRWVTVTAPNGTQKKYTININRAAPEGVTENPDVPTVNPYEVTIGEESWILVSEYSDDIKLAGFSVSSAMVGATELPVLKSDTTHEIVVFAKTADESKSGYFTYNEITGAFNVYRIFNTASNSYVLLDIESNLTLPKGYYKTNANIGGYDISVIKYEDAAFSDFLIVYAENQSGSKDYYRVDTKDNSVQRLIEFSTALKSADTMANGTIVTRFIALSNTERLMVCAAALAVLLIVILIIVLIVKLVRGSAYSDQDEITEFDELEDFDDLDFEEEEEEYEDEDAEDEDEF